MHDLFAARLGEHRSRDRAERRHRVEHNIDSQLSYLSDPAPSSASGRAQTDCKRDRDLLMGDRRKASKHPRIGTFAAPFQRTPKRWDQAKLLIFLARPARFERATPRLGIK
jgi:hypothetical protein